MLEKLKSNTKNTKMSSTHFPVVKFVGCPGKDRLPRCRAVTCGCWKMATLQDLKEVGNGPGNEDGYGCDLVVLLKDKILYKFI